MKNGYINIIHDPVVYRYVINPTYIMDVYRLFGVDLVPRKMKALPRTLTVYFDGINQHWNPDRIVEYWGITNEYQSILGCNKLTLGYKQWNLEFDTRSHAHTHTETEWRRNTTHGHAVLEHYLQTALLEVCKYYIYIVMVVLYHQKNDPSVATRLRKKTALKWLVCFVSRFSVGKCNFLLDMSTFSWYLTLGQFLEKSQLETHKLNQWLPDLPSGKLT